MSEENEQRLIQRAKKGDLGAYSALVQAHQRGVRAALAARLHDVTMADDLAQEAFLIAFDKLRSFESGRPFGSWIRGIALNCFRNYVRLRQPFCVGDAATLDALLNEHIDRSLPEEKNRAELLFDLLSTCLEKLKGKDRKLIEKRYFNNESIASIKGELGLQHSAVTMRLHRLRSALRQCIEGQLPREEGL